MQKKKVQNNVLQVEYNTFCAAAIRGSPPVSGWTLLGSSSPLLLLLHMLPLCLSTDPFYYLLLPWIIEW